MIQANARPGRRIRESRGDRVFNFSVNLIGILVMLIVLIPLIFVVAASFSDPDRVLRGEVLLIPKGFTLQAYTMVFENEAIWRGYRNTIFYTLAGTFINIILTVMAAYPLSRKEMKGRRFFTLIILFTMYFNGGLIPTYLLVRDLGMYNTRWALIVPGVVNVWNVIVCRTNINSTIPEEMYEAASIDGCGYFRFFLRMVVPLSKPIIAVIVLWTAIGHWNSYFNALIFILDNDKKPLQLYLREYLVSSNVVDLSNVDFNTESLGIQELVKNSLILLSVLPLWIFYPFIQKYFVKGVMVGAVKG